MANIEVGKRASALVLQMGPIAGDVCTEMRSNKIMEEPDGVVKAPRMLHDNVAPNASGEVYHEVVRFSRPKWTTQCMDEYFVEFDFLRR